MYEASLARFKKEIVWFSTDQKLFMVKKRWLVENQDEGILNAN